MKRQKRGEGFGMVVTISIILIAIGIIFFFPLITAVVNFITGQGDSSACTISLYKGRGTASCPIDEVKIYADKVEINDEVVIEKGSRTTNDMANEALAKLLQTCLSRGGGLNSQAFGGAGWFGEDTYCMECSHIVIDNGVGAIPGFKSYLENTMASPAITDKTYMDLLTKDAEHREAYLAGLSETYEVYPSNKDSTLPPNKDYSVFFIGFKKPEGEKWWDRIGDAFSGNFKSLLLEAFKNHDTYYAYASKFEDLGKFCPKKVN